MGREIRRVPPNWQHPLRTCTHYPRKGGCLEAERNGGKCYQPMRDQDAESAFQDWNESYAEWLAGEHDRIIAEYGATDYPKDEPYRSFCDWYGQPPDPDYYRPKWDESKATWCQMYQTVSEGTPVTPAFASKTELVEYLVAHGDFSDQERGYGPWDRAAAEAFVREGFAPSMVSSGGVISEPRDRTMYE